ncbi:MAG: hypothetical protein KDB82_15535 [Planctomycetes bacterium]|nr:hypothetical protein [Planctomycetota bacterium]
MKEAAADLIKQLKASLPGVETEVRQEGENSVWLDVSLPGAAAWWEVELRGPQFLAYSHYPNDPDDVAFAPPDDWFATARALALFLKSALTIRASDSRALGRFVLSAHRDERERTYTFETQDEAIAFAVELIKQGVIPSDMAFYQQSPLPPAALQSTA